MTVVDEVPCGVISDSTKSVMILSDVINEEWKSDPEIEPPISLVQTVLATFSSSDPIKLIPSLDLLSTFPASLLKFPLSITSFPDELSRPLV
uniref:Uncharacterized protein n=1 Tax=Arundo donax TaxID=35708 RepID=A0A0A8Y897_ARUDO